MGHVCKTRNTGSIPVLISLEGGAHGGKQS
jgi:hypothetical protein